MTSAAPITAVCTAMRSGTSFCGCAGVARATEAMTTASSTKGEFLIIGPPTRGDWVVARICQRCVRLSRQALAIPQPRIEEVAQRVPQHVERQDDDADRHAGKDREMRRRLQIPPSLPAEHAAPGRSRRRSEERRVGKECRAGGGAGGEM